MSICNRCCNSAVDLSTGDKVREQFKCGKVTVTKPTDEELSKAGKSLRLQIGDTADPYNQLKVDIKDLFKYEGL